jgi:hypothetical protein
MTRPEIEVPVWHPSFIYQPGDFIRLSATQIGVTNERLCLDNFALKSRPSTKVSKTFTQNSSENFQSFPLGLLKDAFVSSFNAKGLTFDEDQLDEFISQSLSEQISQSKNPVHPATTKWLADAVAGFASAWLKANAESQDVFTQLIDPIAFSNSNQNVEWFAWGFYLTTEDFKVREFRMLKMHSAGKSNINPQRLAAIVKVLTQGEANSGMDFRSPTEALNGIWPAPAQVRIRELGVLDGSQKLIFSESHNDIDLLNEDFYNLVSLRLKGGEQKVSSECLKCKANPVCPSLPSAAGLLGVINTSENIKSFSPSKLNTYLRCNHAYFLQHELSLPSLPQLSTIQQERGLSVHAWIEEAHKRNQPCQISDLPSDSDFGKIANNLNWNSEHVAASEAYLKNHLKTCPIKGSTQLQHEVEMWVMDSDSQSLVGTRPDLVYFAKNTLVWRETKSTDKNYEVSPEAFLDIYPQLPLAIVLMSRVKNLPNIPKEWSQAAKRKVELEILTKDSATLIDFDISDPTITSLAWQKLAQAADFWINDKEFIPSQNPPCNWCSVSKWCEFANTESRITKYQGVSVDTNTGEIIEADSSLSQDQQIARALGLMASLNEVVSDDGSVPF